MFNMVYIYIMNINGSYFTAQHIGLFPSHCGMKKIFHHFNVTVASK